VKLHLFRPVLVNVTDVCTTIYQCVYETVTQIPTTVTSVDVHLRMAAQCVSICQRSLQVLYMYYHAQIRTCCQQVLPQRALYYYLAVGCTPGQQHLFLTEKQPQVELSSPNYGNGRYSERMGCTWQVTVVNVSTNNSPDKLYYSLLITSEYK
jgi:hypothetical protein